jgi:hypothetical protein
VRVRLFIDKRSDNSFSLCYTDVLGTIDITALRDDKGNISGIGYLREEEALSIIKDMDLTELENIDENKTPEVKVEGSTAFEDQDIYRLTIKELPAELKKWIKECDKKQDLYVTDYKGRYYVYCNSLTGDFAWKPDVDSKGNLELSLYEINVKGKKNSDTCALLSIRDYNSLAVTYKDKTLRHKI